MLHLFVVIGATQTSAKGITIEEIVCQFLENDLKVKSFTLNLNIDSPSHKNWGLKKPKMIVKRISHVND